MSLRDEENMVDLDKIAAVYLSFPYITAEVEIAGFYVSSPYFMNHNLKMRLLICPNFKLNTKENGNLIRLERFYFYFNFPIAAN